MTPIITVTSDPAISVAQDNPAITAVVPVSANPVSPLTGIYISTPLQANVDFNSVTTPGFYYTIDTNSADAPASGQLWYLTVEVYGVANLQTQYCVQTATELSNNPPATFIRSQIGGTWNGWQQLVALSSLGKLPAVDGSQLINLPPVTTNCGRLVYVSPTSIALQPFKGDLVTINGANYAIPSGGVTLSSTGLTASTLYYIYASIVSAVMVLTASTVGHSASSTAGNVGTEIQTGNDSYSLVGMVYTNVSGQFADSSAARTVRSWFNRAKSTMSGTFTASRTTTSTSFVEINTEIRTGFLTWADDAVAFELNGAAFNTSASDNVYSVIAVDGAAAGQPSKIFANVGASLSNSAFKSGLAEGYHYATLLGRTTSGAGSATWLFESSVMAPEIQGVIL